MSDSSSSNHERSKDDSVEVRYDYEDLDRYLADGLWYAAYEETQRAVRQIARETVGYMNDDRLYVEHLTRFPCQHYRNIDELWTRHTDQLHGLSIQKRIYRSLGGTMAFDHEVWLVFLQKIGWRQGEIDFTENAPPGHLPWLLSSDMVALDSSDGYSRWVHEGYGGKTGCLFGMYFERLDECGL